VVEDDEATSEDVVLAAYTWTAGTCFKCGRHDTPTAAVGALPRAAGHVTIQACQACVLRLERDRERAAQRYGWLYSPGTPLDSPPAPGENP
jgi:hypothetical protein